MRIARQLAIAAIASALFLDRAWADDDRAKVLFQEGVALAKEERWREALSKFEASRDLVERASTVFNIGTTLVRLERHMDAIDAFEQFLDLSERPEQEKAARELIAQSKSNLASVDLKIEPTGAALFVDGEAHPANGPVRHLLLDPGERIFEVSAEGFDPVRETIALSPGARVEHTISLSPVPPPIAVVPPPSPPPFAPVVETEPEAERSIFATPWFWVIVGSVVVVTAVGVGIGVGTRRTADPVGGTTMDVVEP